MKVIIARALRFVSEYEGERGRAYLAMGGASRKYCHIIRGIISSPSHYVALRNATLVSFRCCRPAV